MASSHRPRISAAMCAAGRRLGTARLSPDGATVAVVTSAPAGRALVLVPTAGGPEVQLAVDPAPSSAEGAIAWLPDGRRLVYVGASGGLFEVAVEGGPGRPVLADDEDLAAPEVSPAGDRVALVVGQRSIVVVALDEGPGGGGAVELTDGADFAFDPTWSADGRRVAWHEWDVPAMPWDSSRIVVAPADGRGHPHLLAGGDGEAVGQPRFSPDGLQVAYLSDATGWYQVWVAAAADGGDARPLLDEPYEHGTPAWSPGLRSLAWSPDGRMIAHLRNEEGFARLVVAEATGGRRRGLARAVHTGLDWRAERLVAVRSGARTPDQVVAYDLTGLSERLHDTEFGLADIGPHEDELRRRGMSAADIEHLRERLRTYPADAVALPLQPPPARVVLARGPAAGFEAADLPEPEIVRFAAFDGSQLSGRLYRPPNRPSNRPSAPALGDPPPLLLWIHGGPTGQWLVGFDAKIAYFCDRGWAVLVPDFRGSTGHGRAFAQALAGRWGEVDVDDCAAALAAAADRGWADPRRMVPIGSSSGGMTVLLLLARHGSRCAAGVDLYGVADLHGLADSTHRFEAHYNDVLVGPLPAADAVWRERSPVTNLEAIRAPLLVLHGDADEVVPLAQSEAVVDGLRALGRTVEFHVYEGEGHGFRQPEHVADSLERIDDFLRRHVLGDDDT